MPTDRPLMETEAVTRADREAAWPFRERSNLDHERWMNGVFDDGAKVIKAFARHRITAEQSARPPEATTSVVGEVERLRNALIVIRDRTVAQDSTDAVLVHALAVAALRAPAIASAFGGK